MLQVPPSRLPKKNESRRLSKDLTENSSWHRFRERSIRKGGLMWKSMICCFGSGKVPVSKALLPGTVGQTESFTTCLMQPFQAPTDRIGEMRLPPGLRLHH